MPLDPSIFLRGAEMKMQNDAQTRATIGGFFDKLAESRKAKPLELENAAQEWVYRKSSGLPTTPELDAKAKAYDIFQTSKNSVNPATGEAYPQNRSIFDAFNGVEAAPYQSPWTPPETPGILPTGATPNGSPMPPMVGNQPVMNDLGGDLMIPVGDNYNQVSGGVNRDAARGLPVPGNAKQAGDNYKTQLDIAKDAALEENKVKAAAEGDARKLAKMENDTLPILQDMIEINKKTLDIPYAGSDIVQAGARVGTKDTKEASTQMDLLKQSRLDLAAPLAKQLGVNPTDKDFQASLERIVDTNSTKASREAQIRQLMKKIERKREMEGRGFKTTQERQSTAAPTNSVSYEDYFK